MSFFFTCLGLFKSSQILIFRFLSRLAPQIFKSSSNIYHFLNGTRTWSTSNTLIKPLIDKKKILTMLLNYLSNIILSAEFHSSCSKKQKQLNREYKTKDRVKSVQNISLFEMIKSFKKTYQQLFELRYFNINPGPLEVIHRIIRYSNIQWLISPCTKTFPSSLSKSIILSNKFFFP